MANPSVNRDTIALTPRINLTEILTVTPVITAGAYTAGMQVGGILTFAGIVRQDANMPFGTTECVEVTILDADKQDCAFDLKFFNKSPVLSSVDHQAFAISSANQKDQSIGYVPIGSAYSDNATNSASSDRNLNKPLQIPNTVANPTNVYGVLVCRGTPTYTTTSSLQLQVAFFLD